MALLGDDGRGYELARKLESEGVWRSWIGNDALHATFAPYLSSPTTWETFMRADESKSRAQIQLQLRVRALLFDKACVSLFPLSNRSSTSSNSKLNPNYLQLHGDDIFYTLENPTQNAPPSSSKVQPKPTYGVGSRYSSEDDNISQTYPDSWYTQFFEKYRATKPYRLPSGDRESEKRTPEQMANYLKTALKHKRSRAVFTEDQNIPGSFESGQNNEDSLFFPETMFSANSVPDSALPLSNHLEIIQTGKVNGVLDNLPPMISKSPIMLERLGIRPEYLNMEQQQGNNLDRLKSGSNGVKSGTSSGLELSRQTVSRILIDIGFDSASSGSLDVLGQLVGCHITKLGRILKVLSDSYRKDASAIGLVKMFLQTIGHGNLAAFTEVVKDSTKNHPQQQQQTQMQVQAMQQQMQLQSQTRIGQPHQFTRQVQNQQMLQQQQHWEKMRRRQPPLNNPRGVMNMNNLDSESQSQRSMVEVKLENSEFQMDNSNSNNAGFANMNYRNPQMQFRQQQFAAMSAYQAQNNSQFRPMASVQIPQAHSPNMGMVRAQPVKVEAFQELMGGDTSMKHDSDDNKLTSPK